MNPPAVSKRDRILGGLWGSLVGDALGVPVEFKDRASVPFEPNKCGVRGYLMKSSRVAPIAFPVC
jgi:ADP-ribosylglycohydrolase